MRVKRNLLRLTVATMVSAVALGAPALAAPGDITLASTDDAGTTKGNGDSTWLSLSDDGSRVAFASSATNLDPGDTDSIWDVYVKDLTTGDIMLASINGTGTKGDGDSSSLPTPSLSADGTRVAFASSATNLDALDTDSYWDVYVKDLATGKLMLASTDDVGAKGDGGSFYPSLSADGTKVAFVSSATNLDPRDTDTSTDVYVKDLATGTLTLASINGVTKGNGGSYNPNLSADGTKVAFESSATNLDPADTDTSTDVYVKDLATGTLTLASTNGNGIKQNSGSDLATLPSISTDGTKVAFRSLATNLDPLDNTDGFLDVYVKDLMTGDITLASTDDAGTTKGNGDSLSPSISTDGTKVAFRSLATNLDPNDQDSVSDVYVKDLTNGDITLASTDGAGTKGNGDSLWPSLSADGTKVAFYSSATNLDPADTDSIPDIYVKELLGAPAGGADLSITKTDRRDPVKVGRVIRYKIKVQNLGPDQATGVAMTDQLPAGVTFVSASSRRGTCSEVAGVVTCTYASPIKVGAGRTVLIKVMAPPTPGLISDTAGVSANEVDPVPGNNQATETTNVI